MVDKPGRLRRGLIAATFAAILITGAWGFVLYLVIRYMEGG